MFENDFFRLNAGVADGLKGIKGLKEIMARLRQYEYAAKLCDIEKLLESASEYLKYCQFPDPHKGLTPHGKLYYNHLFNYCIANDWKNVPENFINLFFYRKKHLNSTIKFNGVTSAQVIALNTKLAAEEDEIENFFKQFMGFSTGLKYICNDVPNGSLTLKCYTKSNYYEFLNGGFNNALPFYQLEFALDVFVKSLFIFYGRDQALHDFLPILPIHVGEEKICLLLSLLANDGLLAWEDFLNIDLVEIDLDWKYKLIPA
jgi:hypothetical protein